MKKFLALFLVICFCAFAGCSKQQSKLSVDSGDEPASSVPEPQQTTNVKNPLTGLTDMDAAKADDRPVAIMINNLSLAQPVQTGLNKADIIYETEVEGGITRLLAVFQDVARADKIGTIRSARYPYVDLAMGHNAIYLHHGQDNKYCGPHLKDTDDINISENNYATRIKNGLATEHTLYTSGEKLWNGLVNDNKKTEKGSSEEWVSFAEEDQPVTLGSSAGSVSVPFSSSYKTTFKFDTASGRYTRYFNGNVRKDYYTAETVTVKNVFVLMTTIKSYSDGYHKQVYLDSGDGYYCVNGTYTQIKWKKGNASSGFKFTNADGSALSVNPGNSWVCIASMSYSKPIFE